ncbi:hypothetical protein ADL00_41300, partial [Streptomyces sp. AS58]
MSSAQSGTAFDATAAAPPARDPEPGRSPARALTPHAELPSPTAEGTELPALPGTLTDRGNAKLFVERFRGRFRHVDGLGWFAWDG